MALDLTPDPSTNVKVTVSSLIKRDSARKTIERLFMSDDAFRKPLDLRSRGFKDKPKRRGGRIYTKYARKVHPDLTVGSTATVPATAQFVKDLQSVEQYVSVETV
ncbi:MAG: hypothetical protein AAF656_11875 [Planctomycetota bacterium]